MNIVNPLIQGIEVEEPLLINPLKTIKEVHGFIYQSLKQKPIFYLFHLSLLFVVIILQG